MNFKRFYSGLLAFLGITLLSLGALAYGQSLSEQISFIMISHTEYRSGETGQIIGKLYNYRGQPVPATCNVTIYNPDKSIFLNPTATDDTLESTDGTHYINFTTPANEGTYEYMINCGYTINNQYASRTISNSFHLSPALNTITTINSTLTSLNSSLGNIGNIYPLLVQVNTTTNNIFDNLFSDVDAFNNFTNTNNKIDNVQTSVNYALNNLSSLMQMCSNPETNSSDLCQLVWATNNRLISVESDVNYISDVQLQVINQTTQSTYDFLLVNVSSNFNQIFTQLTGIQTGINQINATTNIIAQNVTAIISNQEDVVYFDVMS